MITSLIIFSFYDYVIYNFLFLWLCHFKFLFLWLRHFKFSFFMITSLFSFYDYAT